MDSSSLGTLLSVDHRRTLEFFVTGLIDVTPEEVDRQELLYNASVLAHYAQTSVTSTEGFPTPTSLVNVFEILIESLECWRDPGVLETAGAQCLLLTGFFEDQQRGRHNIGWFSKCGASFFARASGLETMPKKAALLSCMSRNFEPWRQRHARLSRELRDLPWLLNLPSPRTLQ